MTLYILILSMHSAYSLTNPRNSHAYIHHTHLNQKRCQVIFNQI